MSHVKRIGMLGVFALLFTVGQLAAGAEDGKDGIKTVFVIAMENHNWTQPANQFTGGIQQISPRTIATFWLLTEGKTPTYTPLSLIISGRKPARILAFSMTMIPLPPPAAQDRSATRTINCTLRVSLTSAE